jgi:hypothetical protein
LDACNAYGVLQANTFCSMTRPKSWPTCSQIITREGLPALQMFRKAQVV